MRKSKIITIENHGEITIKEVSPYAVYQALAADSKTRELLALAAECVSLPPEKLQTLYASEIEIIVDAFVEVNSSFVARAGKLGLKSVLSGIITEIVKNLPPLFAASLRQAMPPLGPTAGNSF